MSILAWSFPHTPSILASRRTYSAIITPSVVIPIPTDRDQGHHHIGFHRRLTPLCGISISDSSQTALQSFVALDLEGIGIL